MMLECKPVTVTADKTEHVTSAQLIHRAFREETPPRDMRLVPCIAWWFAPTSYTVVDAFPTCVRCIGTKIR